jgi:hypothetical protein
LEIVRASPSLGIHPYAWEIVGGFLLSSVTIVVIDELYGGGGVAEEVSRNAHDT